MQLNNIMGAFWTLSSKISELESGSRASSTVATAKRQAVLPGPPSVERRCAVNIPRLTEECIRRHSEEGKSHKDCKICTSVGNEAQTNVENNSLGKRKRVKKSFQDYEQ